MMGIYETFSKRMKRLAQAGQQDVYQYDELPETFRIKVAHIWESAIGHYKTYRDHSVRSCEDLCSNRATTRVTLLIYQEKR
jgi:hypothetical protein